MAIKHILFDLDGTLLPMVQDEFVRFYMPLLAKAYLKKGVEMDPKGFIGAVWKGYEAMVKNDGSKTNREAFWSYIDEFLPLSVEESEAIADAFYEDEFNQAKCTTQPTPLSDMVIKEAKKKGIEVYLATNPIFPRCATMNRIDWAGLDPEDFKIITTYEDHVYCKPNPEYFRQILEQFELDPSECLMVGNDVEEAPKNDAANTMNTRKKRILGSQCVASQLKMSAVTASPPTMRVMTMIAAIGSV